MERGCARADSEGIKNEVDKIKENKKSMTTTNSNAHCEEEPEAGERIPSSPQKERCPSTREHAGSARKSTAPSNLGASSHSGNARGRMSEGVLPQPMPSKREMTEEPLTAHFLPFEPFREFRFLFSARRKADPSTIHQLIHFHNPR